MPDKKPIFAFSRFRALLFCPVRFSKALLAFFFFLRPVFRGVVRRDKKRQKGQNDKIYPGICGEFLSFDIFVVFVDVPHGADRADPGSEPTCRGGGLAHVPDNAELCLSHVAFGP